MVGADAIDCDLVRAGGRVCTRDEGPESLVVELVAESTDDCRSVSEGRPC